MQDIEVKIFFEANIIPKGCRKPRAMPVKETARLTIATCQPNDIKLALECSTNTMKDLYLYKGQKYHYFTDSAFLNDPKYWHQQNRDIYNYSSPCKQLDLKEVEGLSSPSNLIVREYLSDDKSNVLNKLQRVLDAFILVDTKVYRKTTSTPHFVTVTFGMGANHGGTGLFLDDSLRHYEPFSINKFEDAKLYAKLIATNRGDTISVEHIESFDEHLTIKVHDPKVVELTSKATPERVQKILLEDHRIKILNIPKFEEIIAKFRDDLPNKYIAIIIAANLIDQLEGKELVKYEDVISCWYCRDPMLIQQIKALNPLSLDIRHFTTRITP